MLATTTPDAVRIPQSMAVRLSRLVARWQGFDTNGLDRDVARATRKTQRDIVVRKRAEQMLAEKWPPDGLRDAYDRATEHFNR